MDYSMSEVIVKTGISNQILQNWLARHSDLIVFSGGGQPGRYRRFPIKTVFQLAIVSLISENHAWSVRRLLEIGRIASEYDADVRIDDHVTLMVTKDKVLIGPAGHRQFLTDTGLPRNGTYFNLTDIHREFYGPHKPRDPETANERRQRLVFSEFV